MLVRVDICATRDGVLVVNVSHQTGGFAPYRLDNCSSETLHLRFQPCPAQLCCMQLHFSSCGGRGPTPGAAAAGI